MLRTIYIHFNIRFYFTKLMLKSVNRKDKGILNKHLLKCQRCRRIMLEEIALERKLRYLARVMDKSLREKLVHKFDANWTSRNLN